MTRKRFRFTAETLDTDAKSLESSLNGQIEIINDSEFEALLNYIVVLDSLWHSNDAEDGTRSDVVDIRGMYPLDALNTLIESYKIEVAPVNGDTPKATINEVAEKLKNKAGSRGDQKDNRADVKRRGVHEKFLLSVLNNIDGDAEWRDFLIFAKCAEAFEYLDAQRDSRVCNLYALSVLMNGDDSLFTMLENYCIVKGYPIDFTQSLPLEPETPTNDSSSDSDSSEGLLMPCPHCGAMVPLHADTCWNCGWSFELTPANVHRESSGQAEAAGASGSSRHSRRAGEGYGGRTRPLTYVRIVYLIVYIIMWGLAFVQVIPYAALWENILLVGVIPAACLILSLIFGNRGLAIGVTVSLIGCAVFAYMATFPEEMDYSYLAVFCAATFAACLAVVEKR